MRSTPGYGKTIGILMIIFGALGMFYQFYKLMAPALFKLQGKMMDDFSKMPIKNYPNNSPFTNFDEIFEVSAWQSNAIFTFGLVGVVACVLYIVGGIKLLKAEPQNYNFAKYVLIGFIAYNLIGGLLVLSDGYSFIIIGIMFYALFGIVIDLVLTIVLLSSDKSAYGIGESKEYTDYTLD